MPCTTRLPLLGGMVPMWLMQNWRSGLWRRRFVAVRKYVAVCPAGGVYRG